MASRPHHSLDGDDLVYTEILAAAFPYLACSPQQCRDLPDSIGFDLNDSTYLSKWPQYSTAQKCYWSAGYTTDDQHLDDDSFFDPTLEGLSAGNGTTWFFDVSPDVVEPGGELASLNLTHEKNRADNFESRPYCNFQQPASNDFDFAFGGNTPLSCPDNVNDMAPYADNASYLQHSNSSWVDCSSHLSPQALSSSSSSLSPRPSEFAMSRAPLTFNQPPDELRSSVSVSSQMLLPRLSRLKCPHCPLLLLDNSRLR